MKKYFQLLLTIACTLGFAACSDDEPSTPNADQPTQSEGVFILNQGSYYDNIEGSLTLIDYSAGKAYQNVFQNANGRSLGALPQAAVVYGSKIYIGVYESNILEVIDRTTFKSQAQISFANQQAQGPRSLVAKNGKVYISMFSGHVACLDTLSMSVEKTVKVGPNPEIMALVGDYLYVPNSDGMNWEVGYGTTASKINIKDFTVVKTFEVGLNPCQFVTNGQDLFLLCKGDYYTVPSKIYRIENDALGEEIAEATLLDMHGDKLYYINAPFGVTDIKYVVYNVKNKTKSDMLADNGVEYPAAIAIDPITGNIVLTAYNKVNGLPSYNTDGFVNIYTENGTFAKSYPVGVTPNAIFFNYK